MVNNERVHELNNASFGEGPVVYWMSRDQRINDNWALLFASELATSRKSSLWVVFCLVPGYPDATKEHFSFMLEGLAETEKNCLEKNIPFYLIQGDPVYEIESFILQNKCSALITDFDPIEIKKEWKRKISRKLKIKFYEVDTHNIVPCRKTSDKREFSAFTFRKKINRLIDDYLEDFPKLKPHPFNTMIPAKVTNWEKIKSVYGLADEKAFPFLSGPKEAVNTLKYFVRQKIKVYVLNRNNPNLNAQSGLSPYIHFGQIAAQRVALYVLAECGPGDTDAEAFLEELIVRKELSDNYCQYTEDYNSFDSLPEWSKKSLNEHRLDPREYIYSFEEFELALTHDNLWNSAQKEMVLTGKMHGYMRMYWAKKILEWTHAPEEAIDIAVGLNDRHSLDGRDPNGYAGIMWSIGGLHDRAWQDRPVTGKIRYMNYNGCKRKFDVDKYIDSINKLEL